MLLRYTQLPVLLSSCSRAAGPSGVKSLERIHTFSSEVYLPRRPLERRQKALLDRTDVVCTCQNILCRREKFRIILPYLHSNPHRRGTVAGEIAGSRAYQIAHAGIHVILLTWPPNLKLLLSKKPEDAGNSILTPYSRVTAHPARIRRLPIGKDLGAQEVLGPAPCILVPARHF